ncbi:MAG: addiction module protein [Prosthecobacter sp.]|uniref:addiction module protein n=1 Tax=Prosthecobacter sp. TaxID=1965333 RepID=UPI0019F8DB25|nr:addiction module protein [Prosthecobacter sp.]MBE2284553.1 addiction module protein [Prosthecobacter sp.]
MTALEISHFSLREKLQIMQAIWEDLRGHVDRMDVPESHRVILDSRRKRVENGTSALLDWNQVKHSIGKRQWTFASRQKMPRHLSSRSPSPDPKR